MTCMLTQFSCMVKETNKVFESYWKARKDHSFDMKNNACWNLPLLDGLKLTSMYVALATDCRREDNVSHA